MKYKIIISKSNSNLSRLKILYQGRLYLLYPNYYYCFRNVNRVRSNYLEVPSDLIEVIDKILDSFPPSSTHCYYTDAEKKQVDLLFNILGSL